MFNQIISHLQRYISLVHFWLVLLSFLSPVTSRIAIAAKPSGHVPFHCLAVFWPNDVSIAARASHVFAQYTRLNGLMSINDYNLKTEDQKFNIKREVAIASCFT
jgi:hypothetical protein